MRPRDRSSNHHVTHPLEAGRLRSQKAGVNGFFHHSSVKTKKGNRARMEKKGDGSVSTKSSVGQQSGPLVLHSWEREMASEFAVFNRKFALIHFQLLLE